MFKKGDLLFKFDLKSGYHHVDIYEPHQKYLGFAWETEGKVNYFVLQYCLLAYRQHVMPSQSF